MVAPRPIAVPERTRVRSNVDPVHRALVVAPPRELATEPPRLTDQTDEVETFETQRGLDFLNDAKNIADFSAPTKCIIT